MDHPHQPDLAVAMVKNPFIHANATGLNGHVPASFILDMEQELLRQSQRAKKKHAAGDSPVEKPGKEEILDGKNWPPLAEILDCPGG